MIENYTCCTTMPRNSTNSYFPDSVNQGNNLVFNSSSNSNISDVFLMARAFLTISSMSHKKLQKLCYYAKAWYLALYDKNIISDAFEAWVHGAVQPALYQAYKHYGFNDIPQEKNKADIPEEFMSFAKEIYDSYGHLTGDELEAINHSEAPWIKARGNCRPWENCNAVINENEMKSFYREMIKE